MAVVLQIVRQLQTLGDILKADKQDAVTDTPPPVPAAAAGDLQSKASGEGLEGSAARKPKGFGGGFGSGKARRMSAHGRERQTVGAGCQLLCALCPYF